MRAIARSDFMSSRNMSTKMVLYKGEYPLTACGILKTSISNQEIKLLELSLGDKGYSPKFTC